MVYYQDLLNLDIYVVERNRVLAKVHFVVYSWFYLMFLHTFIHTHTITYIYIDQGKYIFKYVLKLNN